jgi:hypothetical protein
MTNPTSSSVTWRRVGHSSRCHFRQRARSDSRALHWLTVLLFYGLNDGCAYALSILKCQTGLPGNQQPDLFHEGSGEGQSLLYLLA